MSNIHITLEQDDRKGAAIATGDGKEAGRMTFVMAGPHKMIIDHTEVDESFRGDGVGRKLLDFLVAKARKEDLKILPLCPYAKSQFDKDPSLTDVRA